MWLQQTNLWRSLARRFFAFSLGAVLALVAIILAITTLVDYFPNPERNSAAPIPVVLKSFLLGGA